MYTACDINVGTIELINHYFRLEGMAPAAELRDVLCEPPRIQADVAFLFKMYHCLEHRKKGAGWEVVAATPADWVAVSFPTRNLANRRIDIVGNYEEPIRSDAARCGWECTRLDFDSEIVLLVHKGGSAG
jgi:16S rRNA (guanine(1405)-N(7))-methyltransferase